MAASKIKGITIEIGGETKGLTKALSDVRKETNSVQKELKEVERALKLDPKNTELLAQKQQLLSKELDTSKTKLEALKRAKESADRDMQNGTEINQEQYRKLQREIVTAEEHVKKLEKESSKLGQTAKKLGDSFGNAGEKLTSIGQKGMAVTGVIAGIGAAAVKSMDDVDEGLDTVMTKTGATGETAKELDKIYRNVAAEIVGDFGDIGAAVGEINTRLDFTGEKLEQSSKDFLKFAKVNGVDVNTSVQLVTRAMGDAGIAADEYKGLLDMLTVASQKSGISIETLTTNLAKYGAPMRALGIDTKQAIAMFSAWEKAGVNTEIAFSGMKKAISNWGKAGKDATKEFSKTLEEIKKCPTIAQATSKAIEVFGAKAGPDLADAIKGGRFEFETYIKALEEAGGAVDGTYGMIVDEVDDAQLAMQNAKLAMHDIGEMIAKTIGPILLKAAELVKSFFQKFDGLGDLQKKIILVIGAVVAALPPLILLVGALTTAVSTLLANPVVLIIAGIVAAIAGVVAAVVTLYNKCEWFRDGVNQIFEQLKILWNNLVTGIKAIWENESFQKIWTTAWELIKIVFEQVLDNIMTLFRFWVAIFSGDFQGAFNILKDYFIRLWDRVKEYFLVVWDAIKGIFVNAWNSISSFFTETIPETIASIVAWFKELPGKIGEALGYALGRVARWCVDIYNSVKEAIPTMIESIKNWFMELPGKIWAALLNALDRIKGWGQDTNTWAKTKIPEIVGNIITFFKELPKKIVQVGKDMIAGLWEGITSKFTWLKNKITDFCSGVVKGFKSAFDIHSPSKIMRDQIGKMITEGLVEGIESGTQDIQKTIQNQKNEIINLYKEMAQNAVSSIDEIASAQEKLSGKLKDYGDLYKKVTTTIKGGGENGQDLVYSTFELSDLSAQSKQLEDYKNSLLAVKNRGVDIPPEFFAMLRDMSIEEGTNFASALLTADDAEFKAYIDAWKEKQNIADEISKELYADEVSDLTDSIMDELDVLPENFIEIGGASAESFGNGFIEKFKSVILEVKKVISESLSTITSNVSGGIPMLASGGIVPNGGSAIVGEAGAELLSVIGGRAVVRPLSKSNGTSFNGATVNNYNYGVTPETAYTVSEKTRRSLNELAKMGR